MIAPLQDTLAKYSPLRPDPRAKLAAHLLDFHAHGVPAAPPERHFAEKATPPLGPVFDRLPGDVREGSCTRQRPPVNAHPSRRVGVDGWY